MDPGYRIPDPKSLRLFGRDVPTELSHGLEELLVRVIESTQTPIEAIVHKILLS
jgi:hypothetical protein